MENRRFPLRLNNDIATGWQALERACVGDYSNDFGFFLAAVFFFAAGFFLATTFFLAAGFFIAVGFLEAFS